jgi:hypothetical protein
LGIHAFTCCEVALGWEIEYFDMWV